MKKAQLNESIVNHLFKMLDPIYEFHAKFVKILDARLSQWFVFI